MGPFIPGGPGRTGSRASPSYVWCEGSVGYGHLDAAGKACRRVKGERRTFCPHVTTAARECLSSVPLTAPEPA